MAGAATKRSRKRVEDHPKASTAPRARTLKIGATSSGAEIAEILGFESARRVRQLVAAGYGVRIERGRYATFATLQGYIRFLTEERRDNTAIASANRMRDARTRQLEIANARADRELCELSEAVAVVDECTGILRSEMAGLGAAITEDPEMGRNIDTAVAERFARTAKSAAKAFASLRMGGEAVGAEAETDA